MERNSRWGSGRGTRHGRAIGLGFLLSVVTALGLLAPSSARAEDGALPTSSAAAEARPVPLRDPLVTVRALGPVSRAELRLACRSVLAAYPVRCEIGEAQTTAEFRSAWNSEREQMDARRLLEVMFEERAQIDVPHASIELTVTSYDIYQTGKPYVFGLASLTDRLAVVSTARIAGVPGEQLERRLRKLVLHEVGHTFGLSHSEDRRCVMRTDADLRSLDSAPDRLCRDEQRKIERTGVELRRAGAKELDRVRGLLARGHTHQALARVRRLTAPPPGDPRPEVDPEVLAELGAALVSVGEIPTALPLLDRALAARPDNATAHATLGIALQFRAGPGDHRRAVASLRRAVELAPGWEAARDHLRRLEDGAQADAQGPSKTERRAKAR